MTEEPPVVIRTHATDLRQAMPEALKVYKNLYTEAKFNGESLTTWEPRGERQQVHLAMSRLGSTHLINVHILANLEPFRYGAQRFIQKSRAGRPRPARREGAAPVPAVLLGLARCRRTSGVPLKQWERDWIWFEAWGRYAWNPDIDEQTDRAYWIARLSEHVRHDAKPRRRSSTRTTTPASARRASCAASASPKATARRCRSGMTLDQLVNPEKYRPFPELWESQSPPGERLQEYVEREWNKQPHEGETPPQIIAEVLEFSAEGRRRDRRRRAAASRRTATNSSGCATTSTASAR